MIGFINLLRIIGNIAIVALNGSVAYFLFKHRNGHDLRVPIALLFTAIAVDAAGEVAGALLVDMAAFNFNRDVIRAFLLTPGTAMLVWCSWKNFRYWFPPNGNSNNTCSR